MAKLEPHRQCAAVLISDDKGRILFVQQNYGLRFFCFPGGVVDRGETPSVAGIRECLEEVAVEVEIEYQIGAYLLTGGDWPDILASVFKGKIIKGEPRADLEEISSIMWCDLDDAPSPLAPDIEAALEDFKKGHKGVVRTYPRTMTMPEWRKS